MKTAIYLRVSTNRQTQAQTVEQQLERLRKHLELQGEALAADNIFRDDGYSGANLNRPGLDRLRDRVKSGVLDRVLLTSPDRLARNYVHQMVLIEEWERCGCRVEFLDRPMSQDPHDQLLLQIRKAVAESGRCGCVGKNPPACQQYARHLAERRFQPNHRDGENRRPV